MTTNSTINFKCMTLCTHANEMPLMASGANCQCAWDCGCRATMCRPRQLGIVTRVITAKGYGFLRDERGEERFMCAADFVKGSEWLTLVEGMRVRFVPETKRERRGPRDNGLKAVMVEVVR